MILKIDDKSQFFFFDEQKKWTSFESQNEYQRVKFLHSSLSRKRFYLKAHNNFMNSGFYKMGISFNGRMYMFYRLKDYHSTCETYIFNRLN